MRYLSLLFFLFFSVTGNAQKAEGNWYGSIRLPSGDSLPIVFHFHQSGQDEVSGTWDSPKQNASGLSFSTIAVTQDSLVVTVQSILAKYRGRFIGEDSLAGVWHQGMQAFPLHFKKKDSVVNQAIPHFGKNISITMRDGKDIYGSISGDGKEAPIIVLVAGSGPTDRNGNQPGLMLNMYEMLAKSFDSAGFSSFRYDKRGVAESTGAAMKEEDLRLDTYIEDLTDIINHLKSSGYKKIFIAGHSEGSLIGMAAAKETKVDGFISISGAGFPAGDIIREQLDKQPLDAAISQKASDIITSLQKGETVSDVPPVLQSLFRPSVQPYIISWFRYDPRNQIEKLLCPILIVQATCDIQVGVENATSLFNASKQAHINIIKNMSHTLKDAGKDCKDQTKTYTSGDMPLSPELSRVIVDFVRNTK